jgi:hypothetical protein
VHPTIFTSTGGHVDGHKMVFARMCRSKTFVLGESDKRGLPYARLQAELSTEIYGQQFRRKLTSATETAEFTVSLN